MVVRPPPAGNRPSPGEKFGYPGYPLVVELIRGAPIPVWVFFLVWAEFAVSFIGKSLRGPTQIRVIPGGRVQFSDWFGRESEISMVEIDEIKLQSNLLTIKTADREYFGLSGFDGLHRFVHDVAEHNSRLVTRGI